MSKTNGTTKIATFKQWMAVGVEGLVPCGPDLHGAHRIGDGLMFAETSCGFAAWVNTFSNVLPGDRVVLRKQGSTQTMTGLA